MKLHIFNPGHDIALASNRMSLTMPRAARDLARDLGWIPALWAQMDDYVLVQNTHEAIKAFHRFLDQTGLAVPSVRFVTPEQLAGLPVHEVSPWGWDACLVNELLNRGISPHVIPSIEWVRGAMRQLSHRHSSAKILQNVRQGMEKETCGEATLLYSLQECEDYIMCNQPHHKAVFKAPWSSSGRGVRFVNAEITPSLEGWILNTIRQQGGIMAEPYYHKIIDFALEFYADAVPHLSPLTSHPSPLIPDKQDSVRYVGLSLFQNTGSAYSGNILTSEELKRRFLGRYVELSIIDKLIQRLSVALSALLDGVYCGPLGVDMMVVSSDDCHSNLIHPCVEINLRRTMGHVALALTPPHNVSPQLMRIVQQDHHYQLTVRPAPLSLG